MNVPPGERSGFPSNPHMSRTFHTGLDPHNHVVPGQRSNSGMSRFTALDSQSKVLPGQRSNFNTDYGMNTNTGFGMNTGTGLRGMNTGTGCIGMNTGTGFGINTNSGFGMNTNKDFGMNTNKNFEIPSNRPTAVNSQNKVIPEQRGSSSSQVRQTNVSYQASVPVVHHQGHVHIEQISQSHTVPIVTIHESPLSGRVNYQTMPLGEDHITMLLSPPTSPRINTNESNGGGSSQESRGWIWLIATIASIAVCVLFAVTLVLVV